MSEEAICSRRFVTRVPIRFAHCDPAGIIFFPQYLVLFNALVEDWFNQALQQPYAHMVQTERIGLPIVHLECDFRAITRMGENVDFGLSVAAGPSLADAGGGLPRRGRRAARGRHQGAGVHRSAKPQGDRHTRPYTRRDGALDA